jgi:hypothetical protein
MGGCCAADLRPSAPRGTSHERREPVFLYGERRVDGLLPLGVMYDCLTSILGAAGTPVMVTEWASDALAAMEKVRDILNLVASAD